MKSVYWFRQRVSDVPSSNAWLSAGEQKKLGTLRFPKRRSDWRLGRWTAKQAVSLCLSAGRNNLQALAFIEIRPAESGAPEVYLNNVPVHVSLSISHREGESVCAVGPAGMDLGCDVEVIEPHSAEFILDYLSVNELETLASAAECDRTWLVSLMWSAKESALKALKQGLRADARSVEVRLQDASAPGGEWNSLRISAEGRLFSGWWKSERNSIYTFAADPPISKPMFVVANEERLDAR